MNKVIRVISALGAGASLVWGIARSVRRKKGSTDDGGPDWPPKDAEQAAKPVEHEAPAAEAPSEPEASDDVVEDESEETPVQDEAEAAPEPDPSEEDEADADEVQDEAEEDEADAGDVDTDDEEPPVVKGVAFENPAAVVELVNRVDEEGLKDLGIKGKTNQRVLETRPIETVHDLAVPGIGRRTLQALAGATE